MMNESSKDQVQVDELLNHKDTNLPTPQRVAALLAKMTLEEKVAQMLCIWGQKTKILDEQGNPIKANIIEHFKNGLGQIGRLSDSAGGLESTQMAKIANAIQKIFVEDTRLGIPVMFHEECLHGLAGRDATSYPQPIGMAATFNPTLINKIFQAIALDARRRGAHQALTPVLDVARDPRWGRVEETFGEDPYLISKMGVAAIRGLQGDNADFKDGKSVIATLKHFAAHGEPESGVNCAPVNISERLLRDTFLFPFKEAIQKGNARSVMASYNEIDGVPSHANKWLLQDVLRKEWGFNGAIVSDYYAVTELNERQEATSHGVAATKREAAKLAATTGVNIETPDIDCYPYLVDLVNDGELDESVIDELVAQLLTYKFELGLFENPYVDPDLIDNDNKLESDRVLALQAARETITLLKNENNLLPLDQKKVKTLAVIGPNADRIMLGGYSGKPKYNTTVLEGIKAKVGKDVNVIYSEGCKITIGGSWNEDKVVPSDPEADKIAIKEAVETAKKADVVVLAIGGNEQTSREAWDRGHMGDRTDLDLVGAQNDLVKAVLETGKPVVVILFNGRPLSFNFVNDHVPAILECWYLGQENGNALAEVLFGDFNPCGKLAMSIPRSVGHVPCFYNYKPSARRGYLFAESTPLYPFGYGQSYTEFTFSNLTLEKSEMGVNDSVTVSVDVKNAGDRPGKEVVQMYIRDLVSSVTRPVKELKGFEKIWVEPGQTTTVRFKIEPEHLAFTNIDYKFIVEPGVFEIMVGNSSSDNDLEKVTLTVK